MYLTVQYSTVHFTVLYCVCIHSRSCASILIFTPAVSVAHYQHVYTVQYFFSNALPGDHLQLRPSNCVFELAKKYNLDLSLFERLLNNGQGARCLGIQHRMRPEIARLTKHFYTAANERQQLGLLPEGIRDHERVLRYEEIKGVSSSLFFLNHKWPEKSDDESRSHSNLYEAQMVAALCKYLTLQGTCNLALV